jgi:hypothetical protein
MEAAQQRAEELWPIPQELPGRSAREIARILNDRKIESPVARPLGWRHVQRVMERWATFF